MLVYGDAPRRETVSEKLDRIRGFIADAQTAEPWIVAHGLLVAALVEAGELAQGVADRAFEAAGQRDGPAADGSAAMALTHALAKAAGLSWREGLIGTEGLAAATARVEREAADGPLTIKLPEGFAHYGLYPETYWEVARALAGRDLRVIGLRSIGTTLSAMVAAGAGAPCPITVRPVGHPFGRTLALARPLPIPPGSEVAIVDEGPGLSGSSVAGAGAAVLETGGLEAERLHVFPSHANGPGAQATEAVRRFWSAVRIHLRSFDDAILAAPAPRGLASWVADLTGEPLGALREISGGAWRYSRDWPHGLLPPVHPWQEKRKFLLETSSGTWLLKFAGIGRIGLAKYERAVALAEAGLAPAPLGFRHGFMIERWHGDAKPLDPHGPERPRFLAHLGRYLGFRARSFPAQPDQGASGKQLFEMLRCNVEEEFGTGRSKDLEGWPAELAARDGDGLRVETDNRLHAWEWLVLPDGTILKADALDHHAGHDLIGCQDITWDIAGAAVEFTLSPDEHRDVIGAVERVSGLAVDRAKMRFATLCYTAFQLGYYREAAASSTTAPDEFARLRAAADRYASCLSVLLAGGNGSNAPSGD